MLFDVPPPGLMRRLAARLWLCCAILVSAGLVACGGRAADGPEPEEDELDGRGGSGGSDSDDEPTIFGPMRETCADNPLLAGCPYANSGGSSSIVPELPVDVPADSPQTISAAQNVLSAYCAACHGPALTRSQASAGINYITDWERLIRADLIESCSPERSRIVEVMRTGEMPPLNSGMPRVSDADLEVVEDAIEFDCEIR